MQLQHLEISGFKSFPDRSQLKFDDGVTAIVGPNGCGKSNVVDAITWVLGEQSAKSLRGDRMEDVIFSGSDGRKPTGAAEVKLMLRGVTVARIGGVSGRGAANGNGNGNGGVEHAGSAEAMVEEVAVELAVDPGSDEELETDEAPPRVARDVEVSRRLYRSGESEYLIDGKVCRLRDVQDLLMDSGVGIKAYAVIEQGKIGQILSARPYDRRQLIEEAAGVTKYKTRRRAAELKLEAAQQNLTRVDDIVYEVDKQRNALKRQSAKARRYQRLRDELRRWEKVSFARRHHTLALAIESADARLADVRTTEQVTAARLAEVEARQERLRIELTEAETRATSTRDAAHGRELEIDRRQQQLKFDGQQVAELATLAEEIRTELKTLDARRGPAREAIAQGRAEAGGAATERGQAEHAMASEETRYAAARRDVEGLEGDVEAARSEVFAAINAATALRHAAEHAASAGERVSAELAKLDIEFSELDAEQAQLETSHRSASTDRDASRSALTRLTETHAARRQELEGLQHEQAGVSESARAGERELTGQTARLKSLEELEAARAGYGDAARLLLVESNGSISHMGSVADHLEVDARYELAVEACLGDLLQRVVVPRHEHAAEGLRFVRDRDAGRCGFLVVERNGGSDVPAAGTEADAPAGLVPVASIVRVSGPCAPAVRAAIGQAYVATSLDQASQVAPTVVGPIATLAGEVVRGAHLVSGGVKAEARGILATKREIKSLREAIAAQRTQVESSARRLEELDRAVEAATAALEALDEERQSHEKLGLELDLRLAALGDDATRITRKRELLDAERRRADEERTALRARHDEAHASIAKIDAEQQTADDRLAAAQRQLFDARSSIESMGQRFADAKALHARLVERAASVAADVRRLEDASAELEARVTSRQDDLSRTDSRRQSLQVQIEQSKQRLDRDVGELETLRADVRSADERLSELRGRVEGEDATVRSVRTALEEVRARVGRLEVAQATAQADLTHLAAACLEAVQADLPSVIAEVEQLERDGKIEIDAALGSALSSADADADAEPAAETSADGDELPARPSSPEDVIAELKAKIERLGAVNMMAIEQFDELDSRYAYLTTQRKDLLDSIAATTEAIRRINRTTVERFRTAFDAINAHYQQMFSTLFGGGRAGLVLLDEADLLESGIDIIAQPPGKRLQSVQLLSGGEKALSAMALMFAIFKYRPSPFCLLDEIDAPLDDINIGRFVEMLRGMLDETQFVLITHNRRTMEIADRLYGVTMEEPGVSKLISVRLN
ncbi:MAG: chromosome segregation protein SMC [Vicinamibacterales bacterium]|jgi:chromosome segregation protein|nr:chromosome segregation protein SMC [Vicinamibacterales bacterium]MDP6609124.1 chromosome segregation protein SMC [Vicinamibacterales bacterium]|tara:strand:+ start:71 stop:3880 length:3810 start_codon:yes stop_codon:yes gene_type:complete